MRYQVLTIEFCVFSGIGRVGTDSQPGTSEDCRSYTWRLSQEWGSLHQAGSGACLL